MRDAEMVTFGGGGLDRAAHLRSDEDALNRLMRGGSANILPLWKGKPQVTGGDRLTLAPVTPDHAVLQEAREAPIFLGKMNGEPWFAIDISGWDPSGQDVGAVGAFLDPTEQVWPGSPEGTRFAELRAIMTRLSAADAEIAATARAVLMWHQTHGFCARCGASSRIVEAGWQRLCDSCGGHHFPRTDPVVIMLVTHGNDVLVGRSPGWPDGMYSLLAGFVEPGETLEAAVRRETFEEAGIIVGPVGYLASQPWPFPASLMMGCHGHATSREIKVDPAELEDARWVSREEMLACLAGEVDWMRPARLGAIARFLIDAWVSDRLR